MEPIPETSAALEEFGALLFDHDHLAEIEGMGRRVLEVVPQCVGLSLAHREHGVTFTLGATDVVAAARAGVSLLGPRPSPEVEAADRDPLDEEVWQLSARRAATPGIASTLTLPIVVAGTVAGSVHLYASTADAFAGKHRQVAGVLGAWPEGAIANADLGFGTCRAAQAAPRTLFERARVQVAVSILVSSQGIAAPLARQRLATAARRARTTETAIARFVIEQAMGPPPYGNGGEPGP